MARDDLSDSAGTSPRAAADLCILLRNIIEPVNLVTDPFCLSMEPAKCTSAR